MLTDRQAEQAVPRGLQTLPCLPNMLAVMEDLLILAEAELDQDQTALMIL
jgi:hypothetical protein